MKKINNISLPGIFYIIIITITALSCARQSSPAGGPEDLDPPVALKSRPINYSTNFKGNKFIVEFDEFVTLTNIRQELLISPPVPEKPEVKQRGKAIVVKINNELKDSTTYNFNFYNAIADLNEGNALKNFQFEFSTGPVFDSIYLGGIMHDAFDFTSEAGWYIMLYDKFDDTIPRTTLPNYVAKTDKDGYFFVTNLKNQPYYIFGLQDMNSNLLFDLPNENIAFIDSSFSPSFIEKTFVDTLTIISSISKDYKDTIFTDSLIYSKHMVSTIGDIRLYLFAEEFEQQYFKQNYRPERQQVIFSFHDELKDTISIIPINDSLTFSNWYLQEPTDKNDSIVYWLTDSLLIKSDTLLFQINYTMKDSSLNKYIKTDTLIAFFKPNEELDDKKEKKKKGGKRINLNFLDTDKSEEETTDSIILPSQLTFTHNAADPFDLDKNIELLARYPIEKLDESRIKLSKIDDDTIPVKFNLIKDKFNFRKYFIDFSKDEEEAFILYIPAGAFTDIYGNINDSMMYKFKTRSIDYYSTITMEIEGVKEKSYVQLLSEKGIIISEKIVANDTTVTFNYLYPGKYKFRLYYDSNDNGKWDTGNYKQLLQPEKVFYYPFFSETLETKSNLDILNSWELYPKLGDGNNVPLKKSETKAQ